MASRISINWWSNSIDRCWRRRHDGFDQAIWKDIVGGAGLDKKVDTSAIFEHTVSGETVEIYLIGLTWRRHNFRCQCCRRLVRYGMVKWQSRSANEVMMIWLVAKRGASNTYAIVTLQKWGDFEKVAWLGHCSWRRRDSCLQRRLILKIVTTNGQWGWW